MEKTLGKILVIDDNEDVLFSAKMLLKNHAKEVIMEKNPKKHLMQAPAIWSTGLILQRMQVMHMAMPVKAPKVQL